MFLLTFNNLITPVLIRFVFYVMVFGAVCAGLVLFSQASTIGQFSPAAGGLMMLGAILVPIVLVLFARVAAELTLVVFMIRDELAWQREQRVNAAAAE
jgi:hypothetical protein